MTYIHCTKCGGVLSLNGGTFAGRINWCNCPKNDCKEIKTGEVFSVNGKLYVIVNPQTPSEIVNSHNQIVCALHQ
jgi:hypothetical protein